MTRIITIAALTLSATLAANATTDDTWPSDPATPLQLGTAQNAVQTGHEITPDGSTWVTWQDGFCFGDVRLQRVSAAGTRIAVDGLLIDEEIDLCGLPDIVLFTANDNSALVQAGGAFAGEPLHRIGPDGSAMWGPDGFDITSWGAVLGKVRSLDNGDVLLVGHVGFSLIATKISADGSIAWTSEVPVQTGSNRRIIAALPDGLGGTFIIYDMPLAYTRRIDAMRIDANGNALWNEATIVVPFDPSSSRHTDPVAVADGNGGVFIVFVEGRESADTPVPIRVQHLLADGSLEHGPDGVRVSTSSERQYDPQVTLDADTGDLMIAWADGSIFDRTLRAQRLAPDGTRQWGAQGIAITPIGSPSVAHWNMVWQDDVMTIVTADPMGGEPTINARRILDDGTLLPGTIPLSGPDRGVRSLRARAIGNAITVSWIDLENAPNATVQAHRLNPDNTLGLAAADLNADGKVDVTDLLELLAQWGDCPKPCSADLDDNGAVDTDDLLALLAQWG